MLKPKALYFFILSYVFYLPSALWFGGDKGGLVILISLLTSCLFFLKKVTVKHELVNVIGMLLLSLSISILLNVNHVVVEDLFEFLRIYLYLLVLLFVHNSIDRGTIKIHNLITFFKIFIIVELILTLFQRFEIELISDLTNVFWSSAKNWNLRNTGSFSNPNSLGFFIVSSICVILNTQMKKKYKILYFLLSFIVILLSGSRTALIVFLIITTLSTVEFKFLNLFFYIKFLIYSLIILQLGYLALNYFAEENKYMGELLLVLSDGNLENVGTYSKRVNIWDTVLQKIKGLDYLFGLGPGKGIGMRFVDNTYIGLYVRYGIVGFVINILVIAYLFFIINKSSLANNLKKIFNLLVIQFIIFGFSMESFGSWHIGLLFYFIFATINSLQKSDLNCI